MVSENVHSSKQFFASGKSKCFHKPTCKFTKLFGSTILSFNAPPVHLIPCRMCHSQNECNSILNSRSASATPESNHPRSDHEISCVSTQPDSSKIVDVVCATDSSDIPTRYFMTQSDKLYHTDDTCLAVSSVAKEIFEVSTRPKSLSPCSQCVKGCAQPEGVQTDVPTPVSSGHAKSNDAQTDELSQTGLTSPLKSKVVAENTFSVSAAAENEKEVTINVTNLVTDKSVTQSPSFKTPEFSSSFHAEALPKKSNKFDDGLSESSASFPSETRNRSSVSPAHSSTASGSSSSQTPTPASPVTPARENAHTFESSVTTSGSQSENSDSFAGAFANLSNTEYYTTRTGVFYHQKRDCYNLRSARRIFPTETPRSDLKSCYLCVEDPYRGPISPQRSFNRTSLSGTTYVTTRTGRYYHEDYNCFFLEMAHQKFRVREVPARLSPCYRCVVTPAPVQSQ